MPANALTLPPAFSLVFTGTQGTGKTTLARAIADRFALAFAPEAAREVAVEIGLPSMDELTPDLFGKFHSRILDHQLGELDRGRPFVGDRCLVDTAAHVRFLLDAAEAEPLLARARAHVHRYSAICYLPPDLPPVADGFRRADPKWRNDQDRAIRAILDEWAIPHTTIRGDLETRIDAVSEVIRKHATESVNR